MTATGDPSNHQARDDGRPSPEGQQAALVESAPIEAIGVLPAVGQVRAEQCAALVKQAKALADEGHNKEAETKYRQALEISDHAPTRTDLGCILIRLRRYREAIDHFRNALELDETFNTARYYWAYALDLLRLHDEAFEKYGEVARNDGTLIYATYNMGYIRWQQGRYAEARSLFRRTLYEHWREECEHDHEYSATLRLDVFRDFAGAERVVERGLKRDSDDPGLLTVKVNLALARQAAEPRNTAHPWKVREIYLKARDELERRAAESKDRVALRRKLGELMLAVGDYGDARGHLEAVAREDRDTAQNHANLGLLALRERNFSRAVEHYEAAWRRDPEDLGIQSGLGEAYLKSGRLDEAEERFRRVLAFCRTHVESLIGLGQTYVEQGERDGDASFYEDAVTQLTEALRVEGGEAASKALTPVERAEVLYTRAFASVRRFELRKPRAGLDLLRRARDDCKSSLVLNPDFLKASRALRKLESRFSVSASDTGRRLAPPLGAALGVGLLGFAVWQFLAGTLGGSQLVILSLGGLLFYVACLSLRDLVKLKVAGMELEKSNIEPIVSSFALGLKR